MPRLFKMTDAHMEAFSKQQRQRFEDEMVAYFREHYPADAVRMGDDGLRELINEGIAKADIYGICVEADVARYIQFMVALRRDFDDCAQMPWAHEILTDKRMAAPEKLERIAQRAASEGHVERA